MPGIRHPARGTRLAFSLDPIQLQNLLYVMPTPKTPRGGPAPAPVETLKACFKQTFASLRPNPATAGARALPSIPDRFFFSPKKPSSTSQKSPATSQKLSVQLLSVFFQPPAFFVMPEKKLSNPSSFFVTPPTKFFCAPGVFLTCPRLFLTPPAIIFTSKKVRKSRFQALSSPP